MAIIPIRALGQHGIITDLSAFDLPANAWTSGRNVRFDNSVLKHSPIFRRASTGSDLATGVHGLVINEGSDYDALLLARGDGELRRYAAQTWSDATPLAGYTPATSAAPWTSTFLSQVAYFNRSDNIPLAFLPSATEFVALANWDSTWRAASMRAFKDTLFTVNVTKGAVNYPNMVKWSDYALAGAVPASWDHTDPTNSSGENIIGELKTPLVDALQLRNAMILYSEDQVWMAEFLPGNQLIFAFSKLFNDGGIMNVNCAVEVDGVHFVFGTKEIYVHDGARPDHPARNKVNDYIFSRVNFQKSSVAFVHYNPTFKEVYFCYNTTADEVAFPGVNGCNEAAVFNIASGTWTFNDLPNVYHADRMSLNTILTYDLAASLGYTYANFGGTYAEQSDTTKRHSIWISQQSGDITADRLLMQDLIDNGLVALPRETEVDVRASAVRTGLDLDQFLSPAGGTSVRNKQINHAYPQARSPSADATMNIRFGGHAYPNDDGEVAWEAYSTFNPTTDEKVDSRAYGRYLAMEVELPNDHDMEVSTIDLDGKQISTR